MFAVPGRLTRRRSKPFSESHQRTVKRLFFGLDKVEIKNHLSYIPETGDFIWTNPRGKKVKTGSRAGTVTAKGYIAIFFGGRPHKAHRLAFFFMEGAFPENEVDHIDGDKTNNRWDNLRKCTRAENQQNLKMYENNSSGYQGVRVVRGKFKAQIAANRIIYRSSLFETIDEAIEWHREMKMSRHAFSPKARANKE